MKRVLVITFFWPPSGKATLHLPLKLVKYLPEFNWQPVVLTVKEDTFSAKDESLLAEIDKNLEVIKTDYFDPFVYYRKLLGKAPDEPLIASETISKTNKSLLHRLSIWIRMNLFIPDARIGWYRQAVKKSSEYLKSQPVDAIITVGPPHSSHLIGRKLSKKFLIPHVPILIDPWIDIVYYKGFKRNKLALSLDNYLEKSVMKDSAEVIFVTKNTEQDFIRKYPWIEAKSHVFYWGYNEEDFSLPTSPLLKERGEELSLPKEEGGKLPFPKEGGKPLFNTKDLSEIDKQTILHAGNIFDYQNIPAFWKTIKEQISTGRNLFIKFIGTVSPGIIKSINEAGLIERTIYSGFLPYNEVIKEMCSASFLLVCATEPRHVPGKLFEYLRTGNPIIAFGNDSEEVKQILEEANAGMIFRYNENGKEFFEKSSHFKTNMDKVKKYDRRNIAKGISKILDVQNLQD